MVEPRPTLAVAYYDGRQPRAQPVVLQLDGDTLHIRGEALELRVPRRAVVWPERQRHGVRQVQLPGDGVLQADDAAAWDAWAAASGLRSGTADRLSRSWRSVAVGLAALLLMAWIGVRWGVPAGAHALAMALPPEIEAQLGDTVLEHLDDDMLQPSQLPLDQQRALRTAVEQAVARWAQREPQAVPRWRLEFRDWPAKGGRAAAGIANAMALPGGTVIVTDALALATADRPELLAAAIGHELGHVQHRHGVRLIVQAGVLAAASSLLFGDFSSVLAAAPALFGQAAYARGFELEADRSAAGLMQANGRPLDDYAELFRRLRAGRADDDDDGWATGLASHPPDAQRLRALGIGP